MVLNEIETTAFKRGMEQGRIFERRIQKKIKESSSAQVFNNVNIGLVGEIDCIVADYPILSFIEIKAYRSNIVPNRARSGVIKFRKLCLKITEDPREYHRYRSWIPRPGALQEEYLSNLHLLFDKLGISVTEGWIFRMILIVPDISYDRVLRALNGKQQPSGLSYPVNLVNGDGPLLIVIPAKRIKDLFY